ncbi:hypothetical protein SISNIDRAFT_285788 [Sistotremastrum niveocremeum HHB9708]|uniref:Uncharacterized protein n=1 Tax=Sistotremastrum niveocremeum HHB9708 TaxID=1314777 RepID=A0A164YBY6_9AGAM|nr:hypothetical protein SISNIDRAFT_285788 [Sistotremastrum niveocremeum HHB9708]
MRAFEANGTTTTSFIGTDPNNLSWKVNHPAGSNLILQVIDSNGNSGGVAPDLYNVIPGSSSSCHHPPLNTSLALVPQITPSKTTLNTCDPLLLAILGGTPPYTLSIAITDALTSPNLTIPPGEDQYLWIDRAPPNNYLIAAACDS